MVEVKAEAVEKMEVMEEVKETVAVVEAKVEVTVEEAMVEEAMVKEAMVMVMM